LVSFRFAENVFHLERVIHVAVGIAENQYNTDAAPKKKNTETKKKFDSLFSFE
jgi:hypothetical protein